MRIVLRLGGSVLASPINTDLISKYANVVQTLKKQNKEIVVVVGGGTLAREFIGIAKELNLEERDQDEIAISISRVFAQLFLKKIGSIGADKIALTFEDINNCFKQRKIAVMGGLRPGITTDAVAALVAKHIQADVIIKGTNQDGVYNKDPKKYCDAIKLDRLSYSDLPDIFPENKHKAGIHQIIDPEAIKLLKNEPIRLIIVNGFNPNNILAAVHGEKIGTQIS